LGRRFASNSIMIAAAMQPARDRASSSDDLRAAIRAEVAPLIGDLRQFIDRRIAELSAELHASSELADMTEARLMGQLAAVHEQIARLIAIPAASTRSSGVELEAVVQATEAAATTILEAAEAIQAWIDGGSRDPDAIRSLASRVGAIFEACSFQDITGQRIRRAIQHLEQVEALLGRYLQPAHVAPAPDNDRAPPPSPDLAQAEIDRLLD
jgi:chemotaxis protein CheZ